MFRLNSQFSMCNDSIPLIYFTLHLIIFAHSSLIYVIFNHQFKLQLLLLAIIVHIVLEVN